MRKPLKKDMNQGDSDEDELKHPEVYFSFSVSCDIQLEDLLNSIIFEWGGIKGWRFQIKYLPYFASETPFALYKLYNQGHWKSTIWEIDMILENLRSATSRDDNLEDEYEACPITTLNFLNNVPKLLGQDTSQFNNWPWKVQANRKVLHIEVDMGEIKFIEKLAEAAKEKKLFEKM